MKDEIIARLKEIETNLVIYNQFTQNPSTPQKHRNVVFFTMLYDMMAHTTLNKLVPEYVPAKSTQIILAQGLAGTSGYVSIEDGNVVISPEYEKTLAAQKELLDKKKNPNNNGS